MKNFNEKWVEILTRNQLEKQLEFEAVLESSKGVMFAIMKYRRILRGRGRGQDIEKYELKLCNSYGVEYLQSCLEELFLEPIFPWHAEYLFKIAKEKKITIEEVLERLYDRHKKDIGSRMISIALTI